MAPTEILALGRIVDELNYYQLLHLKEGAPAAEVKRAYYASSRTFHPDANRNLAPELRAAVERIAKRVTEAYSILRDPRRRQAYDDKLSASHGIRMPLAEAEAEAARRNQQRDGHTPQGRQYYKLASTSLKRGDLAGTMRNLQTALTFEPDNEGFQAELEDVRRKLNFAPR